MLHKYFALFQNSAQQTLKNYQALIGLSFLLVVCLVIFSHLWQITVPEHSASYSPESLLWYIALNQWLIFSVPQTHLTIEDELKTGTVIYYLTRPISYLGMKFSEACGIFVIQLLTLGAVAFFFSFALTGTLQCSSIELLLHLFLSLCSGILYILVTMIIGLTAFWLHEVTPVSWIWEKLLFVFGGLILPLSLYPPFVQKIAHFLPFSVILGARASLILECSFTSLLLVFSELIIWTCIALFIMNWVFNKALQALSVEGG